MLKNYFLFILALLLTSIFVACEKDEEVSEQSGGTQVSGGEVAGGELSGGDSTGGAEESDMGLEGGQPESQLIGGSEGGSEVLPEEPAEGGQTAEVDCEEQSSEESDQEEDSCLPEDEDLPAEGGAETEEAVDETSGGELVEEESEESDPSEG